MAQDTSIEALIAQGNIATLPQIDPTKTFVEVGVFQKGTNARQGDGTSYKSYAMSVSQFGGGGPPVSVVDTKNIIMVDPLATLPGIKYDMFRPYADINAALQVAIPGDLVFVNPGLGEFTYFIFGPTTKLFQPGVSLYLSKGVILNVFNTATATTTNSTIYYFILGGPGFVVGETVTSSSGGTGIITQVDVPFPGALYVAISNGVFLNGDTITGVTSGTVGSMYYTQTFSRENDISILGYGDIRFYSFSLLGGAYSGNFTMEADYITYYANSYYGGGFSGNVNVTCREKMSLLTVGSAFYWDNPDYYLSTTTTKPNVFILDVNEVQSASSAFILYQESTQLNFNIEKYRYAGAQGQFAKDFFRTHDPIRPLINYAVVSHINVNDFVSDKSTPNYSDSSFFFYLGSPSTITFITGKYTYLGNGTAIQTPALFQISGSQTLFIDADITVINGSVYLDLNGDGNVEIAGNAFVDNSAVGFMEYLFAAYFISGTKLRILANTRMIDAFNPIVQIGTYTQSLSPEVDIVDCQLVNEDASGTAFAIIGKGFDGCPSCGGSAPYPMPADYGKLRIVNARLVTEGSTSIEGGAPGNLAELVTVYSNKTTVNILNSVPAMPGLFVDAGLTAAGF